MGEGSRIKPARERRIGAEVCRMIFRTEKRAIFTLMFFLAAGFLCAQRSMSITVQKVEVRTSPSFLGGVVATLVYGDSVRVRKEQGSWYQITIPDTRDTGWIHSTSVTRKRIVFAASSADMSTEATSSEVALAGKGFNKQVESQFIEENQYDYAWVDRMEGIVVQSDEILAFLEEGGLLTTEGDQE